MSIIRKINTDQYTYDGKFVYLRRDGESFVDPWGTVYPSTAAEVAAAQAQYEADRIARTRPSTKPSGRAVGYTGYNRATGYDGRGNRVADGAEWLWR